MDECFTFFLVQMKMYAIAIVSESSYKFRKMTLFKRSV